jgi:peptide/nickel transport system permease protein
LLPGLVAGSIIVEYVFNIPGMGSLSLLSLNSRDYPVQMALFCFGGALTLGGIMLADMLYVAVDPRIKFSKQ